jgi:hypothetical protein
VRELLIDWLQGTFPSGNRAKIEGLIRSCFGGGSFVFLNHGLKFYKQAFRHTSGAMLGVDQRIGGVGAASRDYLELGGRVIGLISMHRLAWLFRGLNVLGFSPTRLDLCLDDFSWSYGVRDPYEAYEAGNITGFRDTGRLIAKGRSAGRGLSFSLGNRGRGGSGKKLTFYDKNLESNGLRNCCRLELSLYSSYAKQCFADLVALSLDNWSLLICSYISHSVDFIDRSVSERSDRCPRLSWWSDLIGEVIPLCWDPRFKDPELLDRIDRWLTKQVAPSFSAFFEVLNYRGGETLFWEFFYGLLFDGERRQNTELRALVDRFRLSLPVESLRV